MCSIRNATTEVLLLRLLDLMRTLSWVDSVTGTGVKVNTYSNIVTQMENENWNTRNSMRFLLEECLFIEW